MNAKATAKKYQTPFEAFILFFYAPRGPVPRLNIDKLSDHLDNCTKHTRQSTTDFSVGAESAWPGLSRRTPGSVSDKVSLYIRVHLTRSTACRADSSEIERHTCVVFCCLQCFIVCSFSLFPFFPFFSLFSLFSLFSSFSCFPCFHRFSACSNLCH